jgi:hypothetical protein
MIPFFTRAFNEEEPAFDPDALGEEVVRDFVGEYIETGWRYLRDKDKADLPHPCLPYYAKIEEDTVPEEPDGIASFAREGPIKPPKEFISDYDAHRLSDFQVEPDDMSDQAVVMGQRRQGLLLLPGLLLPRLPSAPLAAHPRRNRRTDRPPAEAAAFRR